MKVSVVIVTYNAKGLIDRCLRPLLNCDRSHVELIVWDNNSTDGTFEYVARRYPQIQLHGGKGNKGFAAGNNAAFEYAKGEYILLLNPDAFLDSFAQVEALLQALDEGTETAAVGPMLVHPDGSHQVGDAGWSHTLWNVFGHFFFLHRVFPACKSIYLTNPNLLKRPRVDIDWICGACMLVRRSVIAQVGGLDERMFMYGEDVEWCERMRAAGLRLAYVPTVKVLHLQGGTQKGDEELFVSKRWIDALADRIRATSPRWKYAMFTTVLASGFLLRAGLYRLRGKSGSSRSRAMLDYARYSATLR